MKGTTICLLLALATAAARAGDPHEIVRGELGKKLAAAVEAKLEGDVAVAVLVVRDQEVVLRRAWGLADRTRRVPATCETLFDVGSVAKQFTATAVLELAEEGKLSVSDPLQKHFPDLSGELRGVTIAQLLHHTAGIPPQLPRSPAGADTPTEVVRRVLGAPPISEPGREFHYSNTGYCALAALVQEVSGRTFETYLKETLFRPAGMEQTGFCQDSEVDGELAAKRYGGTGGGQEIGSASYYAWGWGFRGCTGVVTNVLDLERWLAALDGDQLLSEESKETLFRPGPGAYACGWFVKRGPDDSVGQSHGGSSQGFSAALTRYPDAGVALAVLCADGSLAAGLQRVLENGVLPPTGSPEGVSLDPEVLARYEGCYAFGEEGVFEVYRDGDSLVIAGVGQEPFSRLYYGDGFREPWLALFARVNARARQLVPLLAARSPDRVRAAFLSEEAVPEGLRAIGSPTYWEILGSDTGKNGMHTYLRVHEDDDARGVVLSWGERQLLASVGRAGTVHPFPVRLVASGETEFRGTSAFGNRTIRVRFAPDGSELRILEPGGPGSADLVCPHR